MLVHLGYLAYQESAQSVFIPNVEITGEFKNAIEGSKGWERLSKTIRDSEALLEATLRRDEMAVAKGIEAVHMEHVSILSYNDENSLSCVISLAYFYAQKDYVLIREMPGGKVFSDIVFIPRKNSEKPAMVVELKWNQSAQGAIDQVKERQYGKALENYSGNVLLVAVNYDKKTKKHSCIIESCDIG